MYAQTYAQVASSPQLTYGLAVDEQPVFGPPAGGRQGVSRWIVLTLAVFLLAAVAGIGYFAWENRDRADEWQERAETLEKQADRLNLLLVARSDELNERTELANELAEKLAGARAAFARSESDVVALERRQRELANEKAQVEDQRAALALEAERLAEQRSALEDIASAYVTCKDEVIDLVNAATREDYAYFNSRVDGVNADCQYADALADDYTATYSP